MTQPTNELEQKIEEILDYYFTGEQYDEIHGTFIRIPFTKQMNKAKQDILTLITSHDKEIDRQARIDEVQDFASDLLCRDDVLNEKPIREAVTTYEADRLQQLRRINK